MQVRGDILELVNRYRWIGIISWRIFTSTLMILRLDSLLVRRKTSHVRKQKSSEDISLTFIFNLPGFALFILSLQLKYLRLQLLSLWNRQLLLRSARFQPSFLHTLSTCQLGFLWLLLQLLLLFLRYLFDHCVCLPLGLFQFLHLCDDLGEVASMS